VSRAAYCRAFVWPLVSLFCYLCSHYCTAGLWPLWLPGLLDVLSRLCAGVSTPLLERSVSGPLLSLNSLTVRLPLFSPLCFLTASSPLTIRVMGYFLCQILVCCYVRGALLSALSAVRLLYNILSVVLLCASLAPTVLVSCCARSFPFSVLVVVVAFVLCLHFLQLPSVSVLPLWASFAPLSPHSPLISSYSLPVASLIAALFPLRRVICVFYPIHWLLCAPRICPLLFRV